MFKSFALCGIMELYTYVCIIIIRWMYLKSCSKLNDLGLHKFKHNVENDLLLSVNLIKYFMAVVCNGICCIAKHHIAT